MQSHLKQFFRVILLAGILLVLSMGVVQADGVGSPRIRFMHALTGIPTVDIHIDGVKRLTLSYSQHSNYITLDAGQHRVQVFISGTPTQIKEDRVEDYVTGVDYTMFVYGREGESREVQRFRNETVAPIAGQASFRFVNLVNASPTPPVRVCITATEDCPIGDTPFAVASNYVTRNAGPYDFRFLTGEQEVFRKSNVRLESGGVYTLVGIGIHQAEPPLNLNVITIVDTSNAPGDVISGAFLTPTMAVVLAGLGLLVIGLGRVGWRLIRRWSYR